MRTGLITISLMLLLFAYQSYANDNISISVEEYLLLQKESPEMADNYLSGVLSGYVLTNAMLEQRGQSKLYCMPDDVSENKKNINGIIDLAAGTMADANKIELLKGSVSSFILWSLVEAYPCN